MIGIGQAHLVGEIEPGDAASVVDHPRHVLVEKGAIQAALIDRLWLLGDEAVREPGPSFVVGGRRVAQGLGGGQVDTFGARLADNLFKLLFVEHQMQQRVVVAGLLSALDAVVDGARDEVLHAVDVEMVQILGLAYVAVARVGGLAQHLVVRALVEQHAHSVMSLWLKGSVVRPGVVYMRRITGDNRPIVVSAGVTYRAIILTLDDGS